MALIALGVTGGIGAYKAVEIARGLQKNGHDVVAVMTHAATKFVGPLTFEAITRRAVITDQYAPGANADIEHISIASSIDLLLVAPATANIIGKFANGLADDFLSSLYIATKAPVMIAPAMNTNMFEHPAVVKNLETLIAHGVQMVEPGAGYLACGWIGKGRLAEPEDVVAAAEQLLKAQRAMPAPAAQSEPARSEAPKTEPARTESPRTEPARTEPARVPATEAERTLLGRHVLVTAGPTLEDIDPVRFVGNRSSGKMGYALAEEAVWRGATVTLVSGPTHLDPPVGAELVKVRGAADMHAAVMARAASQDVIVMAAAVADYTPSAPAGEKLKKSDSPLTFILNRTKDILGDLGRLPSRRQGLPVLIGFAAETENVVAYAQRKLLKKGVDMIVANDVSRSDAGFDVDTNAVTLVTARGNEEIPLQAKSAIAGKILDRVEQFLIAVPAKDAKVRT